MRFRQSVRYGDWKFFEVQLAWGPIAIGDTGDGSYRTLFSKLYAGYLDESTNRLVLLAHDGSSWVPVDESLFPQPPHPVEEIRHIAVAFDQAARLVMAYERAGEVFVYQWDPVAQEYVVRGPFPGADPVLINDATAGYFPPDSDILLFHLTPDRKTLVMRAQRELYDTPRTVQSFDYPVVLDQAVALPYQIELLGSAVSALNTTGYVLRSEMYPVYLNDALGQAALVPPSEGAYIPVVIVQDLGTDLLGTATLSAPTMGAYIPTVIVLDLGTDTVGQAQFAAPTTGAYVYAPAFLAVDLGMDTLGTASFTTPTTGSYALAVIVVDTTTWPGYTSPDVLGAATFSAPTTGAYEPA